MPRANGNLRKIGNSRTIDYHNSIISAETDQTYISSLHPSTGTTTAYIENCGSSINSNGGSSQVSLLNGNSSNGSQMTMNAFLMDDFDGYLAPGVLEFDDGNTKLIFQGEIGRVRSSYHFLHLTISLEFYLLLGLLWISLSRHNGVI